MLITGIIEPSWNFVSKSMVKTSQLQDFDIKQSDMIGNVAESGCLYLIVNEFIELINNKSYRQAYDLLSQDLKDSHYPNVSSFEAFCKKSLSSKYGKDFEILNYKQLNEGKYLCKVRFLDLSTSETGIQPQSDIEDDMIININTAGKYSISLSGLLNSHKLNISEKTGEIRIAINRINKFYDATALDIEVYNGENKKIDLIDNKNEAGKMNVIVSYMSPSGGGEHGKSAIFDKYGAFRRTDYSINPKSKSSFELFFDVKPQDEVFKLGFNNIRVGNEVRKLELWR